MALPRKYATQAEIPEALREHYVQVDDGTWQLDLDGEGVTDPRVQRALQGEREQRRRATEELQRLKDQYKDVDLAHYAEMQQKLQELEDAGQGKGKAQEEAAAARKFERQIAQLNNQLQQQQDQLKQAEGKFAGLRQKYAAVAIEDRLAKAALEAGADPKKIKFLVQEARHQWQLNDEDEPTPMDDTGNILYGADAMRPLSMSEQVKGLLKEYPFFALESSGGNTQQTRSSNGLGQQFTVTREQALRNPAHFEQVQLAAQKAGQQVTIVE